MCVQRTRHTAGAGKEKAFCPLPRWGPVWCLLCMLIPTPQSSVQTPVPNRSPGQIPEFAVILLNLLQGLGVDLLLQVFRSLAARRRRPLGILQRYGGRRRRRGAGTRRARRPWPAPWAQVGAPGSHFVKSTVCSLRLAPLSRRDGSFEKW